MGPAKRKIKIREKNPRAVLHYTYNNWIKDFQKKARQIGVDALLVFFPPKTSTDLYRIINLSRRSDQNQEHRWISIKEELIELDKVIEKVRERISFLESASKQNVENSSHQGGDLTSATSTVVGDAAATLALV